MADSVDRVFGHALNTVNKIRPGSQKPPLSDRQELYGLYKQSMEGDVAEVADRPTASNVGNTSSEHLKKEQEKWDAWKSNEGLTRTEAKRRYIEKLINTMHQYASFTPEARELVEELEFVWDQIKNNSQHSTSENSSPLRHVERSGYIQTSSSSGVVAMGSGMGGQERADGGKLMRVLSPVSQAEQEEMLEEEREEFVDAQISQVDGDDFGHISDGGKSGAAAGRYRDPNAQGSEGRQRTSRTADARWRKRIESGVIKLTLEVAALREQLESKRYLQKQSQTGLLSWIARLSWWAVQLIVADAVLLWIIILYMRRRQDHRLEMAVRVLLGDAVAQVQKVGNQVKMPTLPRMPGRKQR